MSTATATASAPPVPLSFRDVLGIRVMRRVWYAQVISPRIPHGVLLCAALAVGLAGGGLVFLRNQKAAEAT